MAQEIYRIEIPIVVDDQTAQVLQQAGIRISKFEKQVEKTKKQLDKVSKTRWQIILGAIDRASPVIRDVGNRARKLASGTYKVAIRVADFATRPLRSISNMATSTLALLGGVGGIGAMFWTTKLADDLETARIGFETMLKSAEETTKFIAQIQQFAKETPFGQREVVELAKNLLVRGFGQNEIIPMLERIGNLAAAMGTGAEGIDRIIYALGQMRALGRVSAQDMNQLTDAGVRAWDYLAKGMGKSIKEVRKLSEEGKIAADDAIRHILKGMEEFDGMMQQTANRTLRGLWGQIQDVLEMNIFTRWGQGIQDALRPALSNIERWLTQNEDAIERWGDTLRETARNATQWVIDRFTSIFEYIRTNYLENPDFQNLDFQGKITFIFDDLMRLATEWYEREGRDIMNEAGIWLAHALAAGIEAGAPRLAEASVFLAKTIGQTLISSVTETLKSSRIGSIIIGMISGASIGSLIPGIGTLTGAAVGAVGGFLTRERYQYYQKAEQARINRMQGQTRQYAQGGPIPEPTALVSLRTGRTYAIAGEAGPEYVVPTQKMAKMSGGITVQGPLVKVDFHGDIHGIEDLDKATYEIGIKLREAIANMP